MTAPLRKQNFYSRPVMDSRLIMTMVGVEYEFEWQIEEVPAASSVFLRVTTPLEKFTIVNFREVRHNQTFGFYRQYRDFDDSGATPGTPLVIEPMRGDTTVPSQAVAEPITGVVVDPDDAFSQIPLWGAAGQGNRQGAGGLSSDAAVRLIPPGAVVLLEFENQSNNPAYWYAYFKQWEVRPGAIPAAGDL